MSIKIILKAEKATLNKKKSVFTSFSFPLEKFDEINNYIENIKAENKNASHIVYAYTYGINNENDKYYDAGEPAGTAGLAIYNILKKEMIKNILIVVVRYFGGTKLGKGNLSKAYAESAKEVIEKSIIAEKKLCNKYEIILEYSKIDTVENYISKFNGLIVEKFFTDEIKIIFLIIKAYHEDFINEIENALSGNLNINVIREEYTVILNNKLLKI